MPDRNRFTTYLLLALFLGSAAAPCWGRVWSDATGQFRIEAELVSVDGAVVVLRTPQGRTLRVPLAKLSDADRTFLKTQSQPDDPAEEDTPAAGEHGPRYGDPVESTLVRGLRIITPGGARGVTATFPAPATWPEQEVEIAETTKPAAVRGLVDRNIPGGSKQIVVSIPSLRPGDDTKIEITYTVRRRSILPPEDTEKLHIPQRLPPALKVYLQPSPGIQTTNAKIKTTAAEIAADNPQGWALARKTFDWVRANLKYVGGDLRGALWAAEHGQGDCEEYTSLFIALARANGLPARAVWVPGHCYAEFYLEDKAGQGYWFPCDLLAENQPGSLQSTLPILQKGDSFKVPEHRTKQRYLAETFSARDIGRGSPPTITPILELKQ